MNIRTGTTISDNPKNLWAVVSDDGTVAGTFLFRKDAREYIHLGQNFHNITGERIGKIKAITVEVTK